MIRFDAAPAIPVDYRLLQALSADEIKLARQAGYVADSTNPSEEVSRAGIDIDRLEEYMPDDTSLSDWRIRAYVVWFCYIFENIRSIRRPISAIEELVYEFRAPSNLDFAASRIAGLYAGVGASDLERDEIEFRGMIAHLELHYSKGLYLLRDFTSIT